MLNIKGLKKLIFVIDSIIDSSKPKLKKKRYEDKLNSVEKYNERVFEPDDNDKYKFCYKYFAKYCGSPIEFKTYIQYLYSRSQEEKGPKLELRFTTCDSDKYMARIAKEENGYIF